MRYRLHALGSCIQISQPIGFHATWSYLEHVVGSPWRSPEFLLPALQQLDDVRAAHAQVYSRYAANRRALKAEGRRFPGSREATPTFPARWHGDERRGATFVLSTWRRRGLDQDFLRSEQGEPIAHAVDEVLEGQTPSSSALTKLQQHLDLARREMRQPWDAAPVRYRWAFQAHHLLGQLYIATHGAPRINSPWNLSESSQP